MSDISLHVRVKSMQFAEIMPEAQDRYTDNRVWYVVETVAGYDIAYYTKVHEMEMGAFIWINQNDDEKCAFSRSVNPLPVVTGEN